MHVCGSALSFLLSQCKASSACCVCVCALCFCAAAAADVVVCVPILIFSFPFVCVCGFLKWHRLFFRFFLLFFLYNKLKLLLCTAVRQASE